MVYIRKFSTNGSEMVLVNTLQGHDGEVLCVKWNGKHEKWISGSEDGTVRIWVSPVLIIVVVVVIVISSNLSPDVLVLDRMNVLIPIGQEPSSKRKRAED